MSDLISNCQLRHGTETAQWSINRQLRYAIEKRRLKLCATAIFVKSRGRLISLGVVANVTALVHRWS